MTEQLFDTVLVKSVTAFKCHAVLLRQFTRVADGAELVSVGAGGHGLVDDRLGLFSLV